MIWDGGLFLVDIRGTGGKQICWIHVMWQQTVWTYPLNLIQIDQESIPVELWTDLCWSAKLQGESTSEWYAPHSLPWMFLHMWSRRCYKTRKAAVLQTAVEGTIEIQIFRLGHNSPRVLSVRKHQHVKSMTQIPGSQSEKACYQTLKWIPSYEDVKGEGEEKVTM